MPFPSPGDLLDQTWVSCIAGRFLTWESQEVCSRGIRCGEVTKDTEGKPVEDEGPFGEFCVCCCMHVCSVMSDSVRPRRAGPARLLCPWDSPGKNTGVGCHFILQGIFSAQGWNTCLLDFLHWQAGSLPLAPPGNISVCPYLYWLSYTLQHLFLAITISLILF